MGERWLCIHGHFYQPPRESPWLEEVEPQDSAAPFHDWNERITAECYGPNAASRLLGPDGRVQGIVSNYEQVSFNFGPSLLAWLERHAPWVYQRILEADRLSAARRGGHGNALAQAYNHLLLPLANRRDKVTQVRWGLADFQRRFGRPAEGMWLPECAADTETLEVLAEHGVRFTVLSPFQAEAVREPDGAWRDARGGRLDPTRPYLVRLPNGRSIAVFFYDGPISQGLAFEDGLANADVFTERLVRGFDDARQHPQLLSVATDGETYGHHRKRGDEVLAWTLRKAQEAGLRLTNYGEFLERFPAETEVRIVEGSSWSCSHGIERWRSDCGCSGGGQPGWHQRWRAPLRAALDGLRDALAEHFEPAASELFADPWAVRNAYVELVLDRGRTEAFLADHASRPLSPAERVRALRLLEAQRQAMLMYTSCGWFFSELSGLETTQILKYAARAAQLAREAGGPDLEPRLVAALAHAESNLPRFRDGRGVWAQCVRPAVVGLDAVLAHYAVTSHFAEYPAEGRVYAYQVELLRYRRERAGDSSLALGRARLTSSVTREEREAVFAVVHFGANDVRCAIAPAPGEEGYARLEGELFRGLSAYSLTEVVRAVDRHLGRGDYALGTLFLDERRALAGRMLAERVERYAGDLLRIHDETRSLLGFLREINTPAPGPLRAAAEVALSARVQAAIEGALRGRAHPGAATAEVVALVAEAAGLGLALDLGPARARLERRLVEAARRLEAHPEPGRADALLDLLTLAGAVGPSLQALWEVQNRYWALLEHRPRPLDRQRLLRLGDLLCFDPVTLERRLGPELPEPEPEGLRPAC